MIYIFHIFVILKLKTAKMGSTYFEELSVDDKKRYDEKLTLKNGVNLGDPYAMEDRWSDDITKLPNLSWSEITKYLIETPSFYTSEAIKAFKSLEGYEFFREGHVQDCFHHEGAASQPFCFIKSKVLPSQRQGKTATLYDGWVAINKENGWILTANCMCMAGLGSACSHVAALLFKLEAAVRHKLNQPTACTSQLCAWKASKKHVNPAPIKAINFKRGKKDALPSVTSNTPVSSDHFSVKDPTAGSSGISQDKLKELHEIYSQAAVFTSIYKGDIDDNVVAQQSGSNSDTDSDTETDENFLPEPLTSLFDPTAINLDPESLANLSKQLYHDLENSYPQKAYDNLCKITNMQSLSKNWMLHRAGRITASTCYQVSHTKIDNPSKSLIAQIMQYEACSSGDNKYTRYGKKLEPNARDCYKNLMLKEHANLKVMESGFHVRAICPFLGASPDGIVSCRCHADRVLEIKCPFKYQNGLNGWENDKDFPITSSMQMKSNHRYYYQIQLQMLLCGKDHGDFFVYSPAGPDEYLLVTVSRDDSFLENLMNDLSVKFVKILLPEIVSRAGDSTENHRKTYCTCKRPNFGQMIACDDPKCKTEWFHYPCLNMTRAPKGSWFCPSCRLLKKKKRL